MYLTWLIQLADLPHSSAPPRWAVCMRTIRRWTTRMKLVKELDKIAAKKCTSAQLALGWVRSLSKKEEMPEIIPIPGATTTVDRVKENAVEVELTEGDMREIDRYHSLGMKFVNGWSLLASLSQSNVLPIGGKLKSTQSKWMLSLTFVFVSKHQCT